jgi:hypothetical protein
MTQLEFLAEICGKLERAGIPFMVAGSYASSYHGRPRATNDVDLVIDPTAQQLAVFLAALGSDYYASLDAAQAAFARRSMFNIVHFDEGWKADLIIRKNRPFSGEEFQRRQPGNLQGHTLPIASPEDVILTKLEWDRITPSERQRQDALHVAVVQGSLLDQDYLRKWASVLGVGQSVDELLQQARNAGFD